VRKVVASGVISTLGLVPHPRGIAVDAVGNVYVADSDHHRVWRISGGTLGAFAGTGAAGYSGDGQLASLAELSIPWGLAVDSAGNVYIADVGDNVVRKVDHATGDITTIAGDGIAGASGDGQLAVNAKLAGPAGVAVDGTGRVFIADTLNERVRMVDENGVIHTEVGTCSFVAGFGGDGQAMGLGRLNLPVGLAVDPSSGDLLIADVDNNRLRAAVAPFSVRTVACQGGPPSAPGPRGAGSSPTPPSNPPRITDRPGAGVARVADQPVGAPVTHVLPVGKAIRGQASAPGRAAATGKSAVNKATPRGGGAGKALGAAMPSAHGGSPLGAAVSPARLSAWIPIAGVFVPLLVTVFVIALVRRRRKTRGYVRTQ